ncbi:calmodulin-regulated spectrin-associated protein 3 isoform X2 [Pristis pectinata]|uniref:calmodulin-regulated spectrin-associated protein 3 isoform X2 n=1 Tax=Pristis pectinata TaxID=685728 RepID=UPI00223DD66A|nr:calmodulin-regulated spectrin-associated protein 3 isoform X2 [Pristis pectinata]
MKAPRPLWSSRRADEQRSRGRSGSGTPGFGLASSTLFFTDAADGPLSPPAMVDVDEMRKTFLVPEIKPLDHYDFYRAKIAGSLSWLIARSYGSENVPEELREPFYTDQYDQEHIKPPVIRLLLSSDIYCRVCGHTLPRDELGPPQDNTAVLQALLRRGLQVKDQEVVVTEADLRKKPIKMGAHLSVIDALMTAYMMETLSGAKLAAGTEEIASLSPSKQVPASIEFRLLLWVDKINQKLKDVSERLHQLRQQPGVDNPTNQGIRYRKDKVLTKQIPCFPSVTQLKDLANGCAVAALIHHYCPDVLRLQDICLKETMSVADSLYNLQLIVDFTQEYLGSCCHLGLEDMLYTPPVLKINILTFVAELFWWFEILKPEFVRPREVPDLEELPGSGPNTPTGAESSSHLPAFLLKQPFLPVVQQTSLGRSNAGPLHHSTSMSQVDSFGKAWTKKQLKRPLSQAISFSIPFGLDSDVDVVMGNPVGLMRSVSSDSLTSNAYRSQSSLPGAPYGCAEDTAGYPGKEEVLGNENGLVRSPIAPQKLLQSAKEYPGHQKPVENGVVDDHSNYMELPTIEEALKIIHNSDKLEPRLRPEGAPDGFFLHGPSVTEGFMKPKGNQSKLDLDPPHKSTNPVKDSGIPAPGGYQANSGEVPSEDGNFSRDDDSVLRDNSLDSDVEDSSRPALEKDYTSKDECTSCLSSLSSQAESVASSGSGVKMTSFAERKMKMISPAEPKSTISQKTTPDSVDLNDQAMASWAQKSDDSPSRNQALASEMTQLGIRLEEKRRAIEAQKKRIEAIFAKHRQRLGKSAFLQLKKKEDGGESENGSSADGDRRKLSLEERLSKIEDEEESESPGQLKGGKAAEKGEESLGKNHSEKHVKLNVPESPKEPETDAGIGEYNNAVAKLNSALSSLQIDMQRLQQQQEMLMEKKNAQAWVIPAHKPTSQRPTRDFQPPRSAEFSSPSPSPSRKPVPSATRSPQAGQKKANPTPPKSPRHSRPVELKIPPLTRVLTPPQNVDSLPHLRKFSPSQVTVQTKSSICFGDDQEEEPDVDARPKLRPVGPVTRVGSQASEPSVADPVSPALDLESEGNLRPIGPIVPQKATEQPDGQPDVGKKENPSSVKRTSLIEIPLSSLKGPDDGEDDQEGIEDSTNDQMDMEQRSVGFFFKDEAKAEEEMALKRAALMEKQQKRTEEFRKRRLWLDAEKEQSRQQVEEEKPERSFTKQEYLRRQQLKVMEDLDKVLRAKSPASRGRKPRPKSSVFRDDSVLTRSPVKGLLGSRLNKVYSRSTLSLSTMVNDSANSLSVKKSPRAESPSGLQSPNRLGNHNGEKDWENASTASSPASIPEYTGPKLYKEPSAKSNKYIIQNAITRCCLAGKVNEPQKNKILEEIDKSKSNHYLILFRDNSCQFRAVYTFPPESEEMHRVAGVGPKIITKNMIEGIYKYNSDRKQFTQIPSKTLSASVDAVTIQGHLWQTKRPGTPKKPSK